MGRLNGNDVFLRKLKPEVWENARRKERASFFEEEELTEFLHLKWDIKIDRSQVLEFLDNYDMKSRTVSMSTGIFKIDEKLIGEVFHLPSGDYKMPRRNTSTELDLSYFTVGEKTKFKCFYSEHCTDQIWRDRFVFLHKLFCGKVSIPHYFMEFVQAEGEKRNWLDAFWWFFKGEIHRIRGPQSGVQTNIGIHISILLAHIHTHKIAQEDVRNWSKEKRDCVNIYLRRFRERKRASEVGPRQERVTQERQIPKIDPKYQELSSSTDEESFDTPVEILSDGKNSDAEEETEEQQGWDEEKEAAKDERETYQDELGKAQTVNPSLSAHDEEDEILKHFEIGRSKLLRRVAGLRDDAELWKSEYHKRTVLEAELRLENDSLKADKQRWKSAFDKCAGCMEVLRKENDSLNCELATLKGRLMRAEQARVELETTVTAVQTSRNLETTKTASRQATPVPEDKPSLGALHKKMKMENRDD